MVGDDFGTKTFQFRYWKKNGVQYRNWNGDESGTNIYKPFIYITKEVFVRLNVSHKKTKHQRHVTETYSFGLRNKQILGL